MGRQMNKAQPVAAFRYLAKEPSQLCLAHGFAFEACIEFGNKRAMAAANTHLMRSRMSILPETRALWLQRREADRASVGLNRSRG